MDIDSHIEQYTFVTSCNDGFCNVNKIGIAHENKNGKKRGTFSIKNKNNSVIRSFDDVEFKELLEMMNSTKKTLGEMLINNDMSINIIAPKKPKQKGNKLKRTVRRVKRMQQKQKTSKQSKQSLIMG